MKKLVFTTHSEIKNRTVTRLSIHTHTEKIMFSYLKNGPLLICDCMSGYTTSLKNKCFISQFTLRYFPNK